MSVAYLRRLEADCCWRLAAAGFLRLNENYRLPADRCLRMAAGLGKDLAVVGHIYKPPPDVPMRVEVRLGVLTDPRWVR